MFGQRTLLWWDLSPLEGFGLLRTMYRIDRADYERRLGALRERLALDPFLDVPVRKLSLGQKMRCELAAALLHEPRLLLLDEPTIGLDLTVKDALHAFLRERNTSAGTTVVLTSHDLDDIEALCRRVLVIDQGRVLHDGDLETLRRRSGQQRTAELWFRGDPPPGGLQLPQGAAVTEVTGRCVRVAFDEAQVSAPALLRAVLRDHDVVDLAVHEARIEDVIRRLYAR